MSTTLEKLPPSSIAARATTGSMIILANMIVVAYVSSNSQQVLASKILCLFPSSYIASCCLLPFYDIFAPGAVLKFIQVPDWKGAMPMFSKLPDVKPVRDSQVSWRTPGLLISPCVATQKNRVHPSPYHRYSDPNNAQSSFSMLLGDAPHLDHECAIFGKVTKGDETLKKPEELPTRSEANRVHHDSVNILEAEALNELRQSETCITDMGLQPRKVNRVGVIGPGSIAIATTFILANFPVIFKEDDENSLEVALGEIKANLHSHLMAGKVTKEKLERTVSLLKGVLSYDSFKHVDLVVEAVEGSIQLKQQVYADLEHYCPQHFILASSSPTLEYLHANTKSLLDSNLEDGNFI
ncbi:hypothetical protein Lser_V15G02339 [Lactuca serriola]